MKRQYGGVYSLPVRVHIHAVPVVKALAGLGPGAGIAPGYPVGYGGGRFGNVAERREHGVAGGDV